MDERQLLKHFHAEAEELVESLLADAEQLARAVDVGRPNPALVNRLFRTVHSLKGLAGMANVAIVHRVAHALEDVLEDLRMGRIRVDRGFADGLALVADELGGLVRKAAHGAASDIDADRVLEQLDGVRDGGSRGHVPDGRELVSVDPELLATLTEYEEHRLRENIRDRRPIFELRVAFDLTSFDSGFRALSDRLTAISEVIGTLPGMAPNDPMKIAFRILLSSEMPSGELGGIASEFGGALEELSRYEDEEAEAPLETVAPVSTSIRVDMSVLDDLALLADDLGIQVAGLGATCASMARNLSLSPRERFELRQQRRAIERSFAELQERLVDARLVPLGPTLVRARRLVEKLARQLGREVDFIAEGEEVRLDKTIVDRIAEPLAHLLGNAVDHGIEPPADRVAAGKPAAGRVRVAAASSGNRIALTVSDDGRGIDEEAVVLAARSRGVDVESFGIASPIDVIFAPGVSTAESVSGVSGRGVGLDAVASVISELGGEIRVESRTGLGATFTVELPTTLVLLSAFLVEAAGWTYAVDVNQLVELGLVEPGAVESDSIERGGQLVSWRDADLPYFELSQLVHAGVDPWTREGRVPCLIARNGVTQAVIAVDRFVGERDVIVKSFGRHSAVLKGVNGAIDLEDERVALLIDLPALIGEVTSAAR